MRRCCETSARLGVATVTLSLEACFEALLVTTFGKVPVQGGAERTF